MEGAKKSYDPDQILRDATEVPPNLLRQLEGVPIVDAYLAKRPLVSSPLTEEELKFISGLSYGLTGKMVADAYGLHYNYVKGVIAIARFKLQAKNNAHAVAQALRKGFIQ